MILHKAYQRAKRAAEESDEYVNVCPFCGEPGVDLIGFTGSCRIPVTPDGCSNGARCSSSQVRERIRIANDIECGTGGAVTGL